MTSWEPTPPGKRGGWGITLTSEIEVYQCLSERGGGSRNEVDTGIPNMGAVTQVEGTELGSMAQKEPQGGVGELQAC